MKPESRIKNFTPLLDNLVIEFGIITAAVYGRIWRYAQQENRVCQASQETIADELRIGRQTVIRHIKVLEDNGYLVDHTPDLKNKPHTYGVIEKANLIVTVEAVIDNPTVPENNSKDNSLYQNGTPTVPEKYSHCTRESHEDTNKIQVKIQVQDENKFSSLAQEKYFETFHRKRWANKTQEQFFNRLIHDYGDDLLIKAIDWAALKNISDLARIESAVKKFSTNGNGSKSPTKSEVKINHDGSLNI